MRTSSLFRVAASGAVLLLSVTAVFAQDMSELRMLGEIRKARENREFDSALRMVDFVIERSPGFTPAYVERAAVYFESTQLGKALEETEAILRRDPQATGVYPLRAKIRLAAFDYEGAIVDATHSGNSPAMIEIRGAARMALGRYEEARKDYEFLRSGPFGPYTNARYPLAVCLLATGQVTDAVRWFQADYADGANPMSRWCLILGLVMLGELEAADKNVDEWIGVAAGPAPTEDYERAAWEGLKANLSAADYLQGVVAFAAGDFYGAGTSLAKVPLGSENGESAILLRHVALLRDKKPGDIGKSAGGFRHSWNVTIARFLAGQLAEWEFLGRAADVSGVAMNDFAQRRRQECEAGFYAGQKRLLAGDATAAALFFEKAVATRVVEEEEYALARAELARK